MKVAILHYHLNPGGVTQVIRNHLRALAAAQAREQSEEVVILAGDRLGGWDDAWLEECRPLRVRRRELPQLDYDTLPGAGSAPEPLELASAIETELAACGFTPEDSVLHFHNHTLGKNRALPGALAELSDRGWSLLLQIHDFAEDFRPENYRGQLASLGHGDRNELARQLYPQRGKIHYAVLNGRDRRMLAEAGMAAARLHYLPNPATAPVELPPREPARQRLTEHAGVPADAPFVLYPVRGIRRKNVGELLLWSAAGPAHFGITLPPKNPLERRSYDAWQSLGKECGLPCHFSLGAEGGLSFAENLAAADRLITTSVAEGFGMVFLEAWLLERGLVGRDLPEITADFVAAGVEYEHLAERVAIPLAWIESTPWRESLIEAYRGVLSAYGLPSPDSAELKASAEGLIDADDTIDFASLVPDLQGVVIREAAKSEANRERLLEHNAAMRVAFRTEQPADRVQIDRNRIAIEEHYSFGVSGDRLLHLYRTAMDAAPAAGAPLDGDRILSSFISLDRFYPLRVDS